MTPVAARIYIYLLLSPDKEATFEGIVNYFGVSKSAVSNALKAFESSSMIEHKTIGGQRKRYFYVSFENIFSEKNMTEKFNVSAKMLDEIRSIRNIDDAFAKELSNAALLYKMLIIEMPIILNRWKRTIKIG